MTRREMKQRIRELERRVEELEGQARASFAYYAWGSRPGSPFDTSTWPWNTDNQMANMGRGRDDGSNWRNKPASNNSGAD